jgi:multiple sugar transport system permease protein
MQFSFWQRNRMRIVPWLFVGPALLLFAVFVVNPIVQSIWISFFDWDGIGEKVWKGLANYDELFHDELFYVSLKNNVIWLVLYLLAPVFGLFLALFLNQKVAGIRLAKSLFFFPFVLSQVVVGLVFSWFMDPGFGLLAEVFRAFGAEPIAILSNESLVTYGIVAAGLWPQIAYCMILFLTGLNNVNSEIVEAARLDGARSWRMLWFIVLPEIWPATFLALIVTVIGALRSFDLVAVMTAGGPYGRSNVLALYMYDQSLTNYRVGYGAAISVVLFAIMDLVIAVFLWRLLKGERRT